MRVWRVREEEKWCVSCNTRGICTVSLVAQLTVVGHSECAVRTSGVMSVMEGRGV